MSSGTAEPSALAASIEDAEAKAAILAEALPYIQEFSGSVVVVKYGGHAMTDPALADLFARDVVLMRHVGIHPVVVHGGGPQISGLMRRLGKEPEFVDGLRVTDRETVDIVRLALVGDVNPSVVAAINRHGTYAVGVSGEDAGLIHAVARDPRLGFVGDVARIEPEILRNLFRDDLVPVVATIGVDDEGQHYNINADVVAGAIAEALHAEKLVYLTDVAGLYGEFGDEASLVSSVDAAGLEELRASGALSEGMLPKVDSCLSAVRHGVARAHILDGRIPHALLLEFFTREGVGTMVVP